MLLVQDIVLTWDKSARGGPGDRARRDFPPAFPVEKMPSCGAAVHALRFYQEGTAFLTAEQTLRRDLERCLPKMGFSPAEVRREISRRCAGLAAGRMQCFAGAEELNLTNLAFRQEGERLAVTFFYDEHRSGMPYRRGRNRDYQTEASPFYGKDCLNETAFALSPGQYGRVLWNERRRDYDTGAWYYQLHICNIILPAFRSGSHIFTANEPDQVYEQTAILY